MNKILMTSALIVMMLFSVCSAEEKSNSAPADDIATLCKAFLYFDADSLKKIGKNPEEYEKLCFEGFSKSFIKSSGIDFSESQVKKVRDSMNKALKGVQFETETVSENGDNATVKITVDTFEKFSDELIAANLPANVRSMSDAEKIDALANAMADTFKNLKITSKSEFTVECKYNNELKMWLPVEDKAFDEIISSKVIVF